MKFKIGEKLHFYTVTESTQDNAKELLGKVQNIEDVIHLVIVSGEQLRGRGRRGNLWYSPAGGLWCSVVLEPIVEKLYLQNAYQLSIVACIAVVESIENLYSLNLCIKWPNDIIYKDKKLGGVLVEVYPCYKNDAMFYFPIIGIGINVNNEIPMEVSKIAISIKEILSYEVNVIELLTKLLRTFNHLYYDEYRSRGLTNLIHFYRKKNCIISRKIKVVDVEMDEDSGNVNRSAPVEGIVVDIDNDGKILLLTKNNSILKIISGHVVEDPGLSINESLKKEVCSVLC